MQNAVQVLSRSVILAGDDTALMRLAARLAIADARVFIDHRPTNHAFMERQQNHLHGGRWAGDFQFGFDVFLWDRDLAAFEADLLQLSTQGMTIAIDCEADPSPFAMHLFHRGQRFQAEVVEQNDPDIYTLHKPAHVRAELPVPGVNRG